jgi:hypothetical protein
MRSRGSALTADSSVPPSRCVEVENDDVFGGHAASLVSGRSVPAVSSCLPLNSAVAVAWPECGSSVAWACPGRAR